MKISELTPSQESEFFSKLKEETKDVGISSAESLKNSDPAPAQTSAVIEEDLKKVFSDVEFLPSSESYSALEGFANPIDFIAFFDPNVREQKNDFLLYPWQVEIGELVGNAKASSLHPFKFCLCASNGSGKDAFFIAPFVVWYLVCKKRSLSVITSSSVNQLTNQTEFHIRNLCHKVNQWFIDNAGGPILNIRKHRISCTKSGSECVLFVTDEEGKAEGFHPIEPGAEFAVIINEAKNIDPKIYKALRRCTGFTHWLNVSSPGEPRGPFYDSFQNWPHKRRVTYFDCPRHSSKEEYEEDLRLQGENDPHFRSKWLALFTELGGKNVVSLLDFERLKKADVPWVKSAMPLRVGLDIALSTNGDETVLTIFKGNKQIKLLTYRVKDAIALATMLCRDLVHNNIPFDHPYIFADDGGVGRAVIDILRNLGFRNINRVLNNNKPKNSKLYRNRGAELWYKFNKLVVNKAIILIDDEKLHKQITDRKYKDTEAGLDKLQLESKKAMIASGLSSPDRADATVLALCDVSADDFIESVENFEDPSDKVLVPIERRMQDLENRLEDQLDDNNDFKPKTKESGNKRFQLSSLIRGSQTNNRILKWLNKK